FTPGCAALSGLGGALSGIAGSAGVDILKDKIAARADWVGKRQELVSSIKMGMIGQAEIKKMAGDYVCWRQIMEDTLALHDREKPLFLIEKAIKARAGKPKPPSKLKPERKDCSSAVGPKSPPE
ncbi:hypothetical protein LCGC14_2589210, partial [marine sediment metagenome]